MHQYLFQVQPRYALDLLKGIERVMKVPTMQIIFRWYVTFLDMMVNYYLELCTKPIACHHILSWPAQHYAPSCKGTLSGFLLTAT